MAEQYPTKMTPERKINGALFNILDATEEFMNRGGQEFNVWEAILGQPNRVVPDTSTQPQKLFIAALNDLRVMRENILIEEFTEYMKGELNDDPVEILDGLIDIIVVAYGTALAYFGPELTKQACHEVAYSNLSKVIGEGLPIKRNDGKILKPESYVPPNINGVLEGTAGY
jgi:hypothetical protein